MLEFFDLPKYLIEHGGKGEEFQYVCVLDKQIDYSSNMQNIDKKDVYAAVVDMVGMMKDKKEYIVTGKAVVLLGAKCFEPVQYGKRVLYIEGSAMLKAPNSCYTEILKSYPGNPSLYPTKTLYKDINGVRCVAPSISKILENIANYNWDFNGYFAQNGYPMGYHPCSFDCTFADVSPEQKFNYISNSEYFKTLKVENTQSSKQSIGFGIFNNKTVSKQYLESRCNILEKPEKFNTLFNRVSIAHDNILKQLEIINKSTEKTCNLDRAIDFLYTQLKAYWRKSPTTESVTGRILFKYVIEYMYPEFKTKYDKNIPLIDSAIDKNNLLEIWYSGQVPNRLSDNLFYLLVVQNRESVYMGFIDYLLSLKGHLVNAFDYARNLNIDFYSLLRFNPYFLTYFDNRLTIEDLDKLTLFYKVDVRTPDLLKYRNAAFVHNIMLDTSVNFVSENTIVRKKDVLKNIVNGFLVNSKTFDAVQNIGCIASVKVMHNLKSYIKPDFEISDFTVPKLGWMEKRVKASNKYYLAFPHGNSEEEVLNDYIETNLGIPCEFDGIEYIADFAYAWKELYIIHRLYELQENGKKFVLNPTDLDKCIKGFEALKAQEWNMPNFKLEEKQIEAVRMLYNPIMCITGPGGSGKTTTAEAILYSMSLLLNVTEDSIMFCAPTGKAANRLKEVVKKPTRTINSLFSIGTESFELLDDSKIKKKSDIKVLIVDESSMIDVELMYNMLTKISDGTRIIFMGDKEQLPPIGAGKPFTNFLSFLPCVVLEVTKRASANSGITRNAELVIHNSDGVVEKLKDYDDFRLVTSSEKDIKQAIGSFAWYHIGGFGKRRERGTELGDLVLQSLGVDLKPDDIQVITPVNKSKYSWGTKELNPYLQNLFNPRKKYEFVIRYKKDGFFDKDAKFVELRKGDRVIHTENMAFADRYIYLHGSTFSKELGTTGVMNGDVGKVQGFYKGSSLNFVLADGDIDESSNDAFSKSQDVLYVAVEYEDVDENSNPLTFVIFYKTDIVHNTESDKLLNEQNICIVDSYALTKLDLAYALTVHKIQGSQAPLIICVLYDVKVSDFISRNLIYTAMTRASKGVYFIGDVVGDNSAIQKGRKCEQNSLRTTISDKIFK